MKNNFRELLKQTVEFIVPYKYSYQNQYSCSPPPLFMLGISLLQAAIFAYNSAVMYELFHKSCHLHSNSIISYLFRVSGLK